PITSWRATSPTGTSAPTTSAAATRATITSAASCGRSKRSATRSTSSRRPHSSPRHFHLSRHRAEVVPPALRSPQQRKPLPARPPSHGRPPGGPLVPRRHPELREVPQDHVLPDQHAVPIPELFLQELVYPVLPQRRCLLIPHYHRTQGSTPNACRTNRREKAPSLAHGSLYAHRTAGAFRLPQPSEGAPTGFTPDRWSRPGSGGSVTCAAPTDWRSSGWTHSRWTPATCSCRKRGIGGTTCRPTCLRRFMPSLPPTHSRSSSSAT